MNHASPVSAAIAATLVFMLASHFNPGTWSWGYLLVVALVGSLAATTASLLANPRFHAWVRIYRFFRSRGTPRRVSARLAWNRIKA